MAPTLMRALDSSTPERSSATTSAPVRTTRRVNSPVPHPSSSTRLPGPMPPFVTKRRARRSARAWPAGEFQPRMVSLSRAATPSKCSSSRPRRSFAGAVGGMPSEAAVSPQLRARHAPEHLEAVAERVHLRLAGGARLLGRRNLGKLESRSVSFDEEFEDVFESWRPGGDRLDNFAPKCHIEEEHVGNFDAVHRAEQERERLVADVADERVVVAAGLRQVASRAPDRRLPAPA